MVDEGKWLKWFGCVKIERASIVSEGKKYLNEIALMLLYCLFVSDFTFL